MFRILEEDERERTTTVAAGETVEPATSDHQFQHGDVPAGSEADPPTGDSTGGNPPLSAVLQAFGHFGPADSPEAGEGGLTASAQTPTEAASEPGSVERTEGPDQQALDPGMLVAAQQLLALLGASGVDSGAPATDASESPSEAGEPQSRTGEASEGPPKRRQGPPEFKRYYVPIDDGLLASENIVYELTLRMLEAGLAQGGRDLPRLDVQQLYYQVPWNILPTEQQVIEEVSVALERGQTTIWFDSNALEIALANQDEQNLARMKAHEEFSHLLANSTYAGDAFLSFFIAHVNAPIALANDAVSLAWKGATLNGIITDASPPQLPKLDYVGEFGQKYGESVLETGAKMGLLLVAGGPLATQLGSAGAKVSGMAGGIGFGGVQLGGLLMQAARLSMATGAAIDIAELSKVVTSLLYDAVTSSGDDRAEALQKLQEIAVYGALEWIVTRHNKAHAKRGKDGGDADSDVPEKRDRDQSETPDDGETSHDQEPQESDVDSETDTQTDTDTDTDTDSDTSNTRELGLSERATGAIRRMENIKADPVGDVNSIGNHNHYKAARREAAGEVVARRPRDNRPYSHIGELQQALDGLEAAKRTLEQEIVSGSPTVTRRGREVLKRRHRELKAMTSRLRRFLNEIGQGNFPPYHEFPPGT